MIGGSPDEIGELQAPVRGAVDRVEQGDGLGGEPAAAGRPWARNESLAVYGIPSSGPRVCPAARRASEARASASASGLSTITEFSGTPPSGARALPGAGRSKRSIRWR